jgi:hypothetical protein
MVDAEEGLKEASSGQNPGMGTGLVRWPAQVVSWVFHPVFVPVYLVLFMLYVHPYLFAGFSAFDKWRTLLMAVIMFAFFPVVTVLLLRALKFVQGFQLQSQRDRVIPLVACGIWYFWIWYVWRNLPDYPAAAVELAGAVWISSVLALMGNIVMKVSLHTIAAGVMLGFLAAQALTGMVPLGGWLALGLVVAGAVGSSRMLVSDHRPAEIYGGFFIGGLSFLAAWWVW